MNDSTAASRSIAALRSPRWLLFFLAAVVAVVLLTYRSYWRSDSLTVLDATVCMDEGLLSLQIPLVRLSASERPTSAWRTYRRGPQMWQYGNGGKSTLRNWMSLRDAIGVEGATVADFGYWQGAWQSNSRPGAFFVVFLPIWAAVALLAAGAGLVFWRRIKFRLATILIGTAGVGLVLWLLNLRAPE